MIRTVTVMLVVLAVMTAPFCTKRKVVVPPEEPVGFSEEAPRPVAGELPANVYFDFDRAAVRPDQQATLGVNAKVLMNSDATWSVEGHCCPLGDAAYNMALGWARAKSVTDYLVKLGIPVGQLCPISYGEERVIVNDPKNYWLNRRVVFAK